MEVQGGRDLPKVTRQEVAELGFKPRQSGSRTSESMNHPQQHGVGSSY